MACLLFALTLLDFAGQVTGSQSVLEFSLLNASNPSELRNRASATVHLYCEYALVCCSELLRQVLTEDGGLALAGTVDTLAGLAKLCGSLVTLPSSGSSASVRSCDGTPCCRFGVCHAEYNFV